MDKMGYVIISGVSGFIGSYLSKKLKVTGRYVIGIVNGVESHNDNCDLIVSSADIYDIKRMVPDIDDGNTIFYNLAWQGVNGADKTSPNIQISNISLAIYFLKFAKTIKCKRFISAGTVAEEGLRSISDMEFVPGGMMYAAAKSAARTLLETYAKSIRQKLIWTQFSNIYGPTNKTGNLISYTLKQLGAGETASFGPAEQPYDFIYIDDLIEALYLIGMHDMNSEFYFIGSGKPRILKDYLYEVGRLYGRPDLIKVGDRSDDGIRYSLDMFDTSRLVSEIGNYVSNDFTENMKYTIQHFND